MGTYLVVGGSRGVGREITVALRERGDVVFTAQRNAPPDEEERWIKADLAQESDTARLVREFLLLPQPVEGMLSPRLDGVVMAAVNDLPDASDDYFAFSCREAFTVNVISPLLIVRFAKMSNVLKPGARVILVDREQGLTETNHQYTLSKAAIPEVAHILEATYPDVRAHHLTYSSPSHEGQFVRRVLSDLSEVPNV